MCLDTQACYFFKKKKKKKKKKDMGRQLFILFSNWYNQLLTKQNCSAHVENIQMQVFSFKQHN